ncbi:DUF711 family protein [Psychromonas ossibalaenae]|uniref:DUF711 family protein n=1 Tax=Psychromonas ossibalaenae TaxID=444922 RepID=UPI00035C2B22|nr:DUF711 family protein [Psychromonas ossibalaenae]
MNYQSRELCRLRTITTFLVLDKNRLNWKEEIRKASDFCLSLSAEFADNGYMVQSIRIVTNAFGEYLDTRDIHTAKTDLHYISELLNSIESSGLRIRFAVGAANTAHEISLLPELIQSYGDLCNACVNVPLDENGILDNQLITDSAKAVEAISKITPRGEGNFNFTVNFNCKALIPYFPASYHDKALGKQYVIGFETPDLLVHVLNEFNQKNNVLSHNQYFAEYYRLMSEALEYHVSAVNKIRINFEKHNSSGFTFAGIDSSAAPSKDCSSMVEVYKQMGVPCFGASGTVEASALLTRVFKSVKEVPLVGFSGLMLAVTEDSGLAQGSINEDYDIRALLTYSAVCGIGLDTVPIPGDTSVEKMSALMRDTGTMAFRLNKPLTVRVFPVPGLKAGDITKFESDDLCNCAVLAVP